MSPLLASGDGEIGTDHKASLPDVGDLIDLMLKTQNKGPAAGPTGECIVIAVLLIITQRVVMLCGRCFSCPVAY